MRCYTARIAASLLMFGASIPMIAAAQSDDCGFDRWRNYRGTTLRRDETSAAYIYVTDRKRVDADGAPNAYHPGDAEKPCGTSGLGLDCPGNAGYPDRGWRSVLAVDPNDPDRPYEQESGAFAGFFVSMTALYDTRNRVAHDPARYADARTVPYLVFPDPFYRLRGTGRMGDLGIAVNLANGATTAFVIGDVGPDAPLGEGSIALFTALGGVNVNARTGAGVPSGEIGYVVFPYSGAAADLSWPIDVAELTQTAATLLADIGGQAILEKCFAP